MLVNFTQQKKYFTVGALQNVVATFKYAYPDVKDKPSELSLCSSDHKLGQGEENAPSKMSCIISGGRPSVE